MTRYFFSLVSLFVMLYVNNTQAQQAINIAQEQRPQYKRDEYLTKLLTLALNAAEQPAKLNTVNVHPHQQRTLIALDSDAIDLYWSMTSPDRETLASPIRVPLFKGYIGKRALVTQLAFLNRFENITTLDQLASFTAVQGHDWPDTKILASNGLSVRPLANYEAMFGLVANGRVDYFPRSFIEVSSELEQVNNQALVIVPNVYISYPSAFYYFVTKRKPELADALYKGLEIMQKDGSFDALFMEYFAEDLKALPFESANSIEIKLDNPYFKP